MSKGNKKTTSESHDGPVVSKRKFGEILENAEEFEAVEPQASKSRSEQRADDSSNTPSARAKAVEVPNPSPTHPDSAQAAEAPSQPSKLRSLETS